ncbi:MAG: endo-1,4-beta-xylanase [Oscillospiraceae bacterium]|nr:endo-1,4-beta-xylanase [Oscillospiraceae bacterium]
MNRKKLTATLTAVLCAVSTLAAFPAINTQAAEAVYNDFEVTYNGWHDTEGSVLTAVDGAGFGGSRGMAVTGRNSAQDGAKSSKGLYLFGGVSYTYSVKVKADTDETFRFSVLTKDEKTGEDTVKELAVKNVKAGEWTTLSGKYTAPKDAYEFELNLTTDSTADFVFDDAAITTKQDLSAITASAAASEIGLKDEFGGYFRVGNILNGGTINNSGITGMLLKDCTAIECENETKPDSTLKGVNGTNVTVSLNSCAAIMDFCVQNNLGFRGHTLVWHSQMPEFFFKNNGNWVDKNTMNARMESYIKEMFGAIQSQYPTLDLYAYDVCNECVSDDSNRTSGAGGARTPGWGNGNSPWVQIYGDNSFVEQAFTYARKYAPTTCKLYYNDYNEYWDHKRDCIYNMCKSLYQKGLLDGVGMQSHINADWNGFSGVDNYLFAMKKYLSIGCDVQITELDINCESGKFSDQDQANKYAAIFQAAVDWNNNPQSDGRVTLVQIWGPDDGHSWLDSGAHGLLYTDRLQPKAAYTKLMSLLPSDEWRGPGNSEPVPDPEPDENGYWMDTDFDSSAGSFSGRGAASVEVSSKEAYSGSKSLYVTGRTAEWNGAGTPLSSRIYKPGETYSFSTNAMYTGGEDTDRFYLSLQYTGSDGEAHYDHIAEATVGKGQWVQLSNESYTLPADGTGFQLYVEMPDSTSDFYMDDVVIAKSGISISGPGAPFIRVRSSALTGDVNGDDVVDVFDIAFAKSGMVHKRFANKYDEISADIDGNGEVEVVDLIYLYKFVHGQIKNFPEPIIPPTEAPTDPPKSNYNYPSDISYHESPAGKDYTKPAAQSGTVTREYYSSINGDNTCLVYTPPGYDASKKYNILYLMHGGGEKETVIFEEFNLNNILDNMICNGELEPLIVVTPTFNKCSAQTFYKEFRASLVPYIEKKYSTYAAGDVSETNLKATRYHRAYGGFSMGSCSTWANIVHGGMEICAYWMPLSGDNWEANDAYGKSQTVANEIDRIGLKDDEFFIIASTGSDDIAYPNMAPQYEEMHKNSKFKFGTDLSQNNCYFLVAPGKTHWWGFVRWYIMDTLPIFFHEHQQ